MADESQRRTMLAADSLRRERDLRWRVADAPILRRAPGLREAIVAALDELEALRRENRELRRENAEVHAKLVNMAERAVRVEIAGRALDIGCERPAAVLAHNGVDQEWGDCGTCPVCRFHAALAAAPPEEGMSSRNGHHDQSPAAAEVSG